MKNPNLVTAAALFSGAGTALDQARVLKSKYDAKRNYTATVSESTMLYRPMMKWMNSQVKGRQFTMVNAYHPNDGVVRYYDDSSPTKVVIEGYTLSVYVQKPNMEVLTSSSLSEGREGLNKRLRFTTKDPKGIDALQRLLTTLADEARKQTRTTLLHTIAGSGYWEESPLSKKDMDSVFLPPGVREDFCHDIEEFLEQEKLYRSVGIPWHRGYLLHGEPGNGKSSLVAAMASHYGLHIYNMPLSSVKSDQKLGELVNDIDPRSVLLIEDIDIFSASMERKENENGVSLAGLLNALDGVGTPHGLVTFITTNKKENLDDALIRPGRIDYDLELKPPVADQISQMFERVYGEPLGVQPAEFKSMAEVANVFKVNLRDSSAVRINLSKRVDTE